MIRRPRTFMNINFRSRSKERKHQSARKEHNTPARSRAGAMPSAPMAAAAPQRVVEVKHGKRKDITGRRRDGGVADGGDLHRNGRLAETPGCCRKAAGLDGDGGRSMFKNGKTTVMLLASAGGGGAPPPHRWQQALAASRKAKFDAMVAQRMRRKTRGVSNRQSRKPPSLRASSPGDPPGSACALGLRTIPSEAFAIGLKARVADTERLARCRDASPRVNCASSIWVCRTTRKASMGKPWRR